MSRNRSCKIALSRGQAATEDLRLGLPYVFHYASSKGSALYPSSASCCESRRSSASDIRPDMVWWALESGSRRVLKGEGSGNLCPVHGQVAPLRLIVIGQNLYQAPASRPSVMIFVPQLHRNEGKLCASCSQTPEKLQVQHNHTRQYFLRQSRTMPRRCTCEKCFGHKDRPLVFAPGCPLRSTVVISDLTDPRRHLCAARNSPSFPLTVSNSHSSSVLMSGTYPSFSECCFAGAILEVARWRGNSRAEAYLFHSRGLNFWQGGCVAFYSS